MSRSLSILYVAFVSLVMLPVPANAEETPTRSLAVTGSVTMPIQRVIELSTEYAVSRNWSLVLMLGVGKDRFGQADAAARYLWEGGFQLRYELVGDFDDGVGLSALVRYVSLQDNDEGFTPSGVAVGPHLYWRAIAESGFTFDVYVGGVWVMRSLSNGQVHFSEDTLAPSGSLNLGWSFGG